MFSIVKFDYKRDMPELSTWFQSHGWRVPEEDQIPPESYFVCINDEKTAFSCFAKTDTSLAIMGFTIAKKANNPFKSEAIDFLVKHIFTRVKECGFKYLHYYADENPMVKRMERLGMEITDKGNAYILLKNISGDNHLFYDE